MNIHTTTALAALRGDARRMTPWGARLAQHYVLHHINMPDLWHSALARTLADVAGDTPTPDEGEPPRRYGVPGAWSREAYTDPDMVDARCWLAAAIALTAAYAPTASIGS